MANLKIPEISNDATINVALDTINKGKQALIFVNSKRSAEKTAEEVGKKVTGVNEAWSVLSTKVMKVLASPTTQCKRLCGCLLKGVAFHHAGLAAKQRELIEDGFRDGVVKVIASTPTLAAGLDLPAFRAVIRDLKRFGNRGMAPIPVLEYLQMSGRAGRPNYDTFGESICIAKSEAEKEAITEEYINGDPEEIYSKLAVEPVLRTYLLSLIASKFVRSRKQILEFFGKTFWAYQYEDMGKLEEIIERMLQLLEEWEFIKSSKDDFISADNLDSVTYRATLMGKRVAELYLDPYTANQLVEGIRKTHSIKYGDFSFFQLLCNTLEMRPLLNVRQKEYDIVEEAIMKYEGTLLGSEPDYFDDEHGDYMKSIKTSLFFMDWVEEKGEDALLEHYGIRPGEIRYKLNSADWLFYAMEELTRLLGFHDLIKVIGRLRFRVKHGIKDELVSLVRLKGIGRVRARKLFRNGIKDVRGLKQIDVGRLGVILGKGMAEKIKKELDQDVSVVKKGTRKGQTSVEKFIK